MTGPVKGQKILALLDILFIKLKSTQNMPL